MRARRRGSEATATRNSERGTRSVFHRIAAVLRRVAGMPDYAAYVEHLRTCHPEAPVPTEREYFAEYTQAKYGSGTSRCC
ncbi:MAG TPA: YbdD/YjiX family protein [Gemmatimonadales bacterium]|nr:YbdD/YjiX family protein [Gemmatimonadales bacterium]